LTWFPQIHKNHHNNKVLIFAFQDESLAKEVVVVDFYTRGKRGSRFGSGKTDFPQRYASVGLYTLRKSE